MPKGAPKKQAQAIALDAAKSLAKAESEEGGGSSMPPLSATPCIRIRYGDRESKVAAQLLVTRMQEEFGDEVRVVMRRNHDDEDSPRVVVGLDFFGVSMQLTEPTLWSGQPEDVEEKEWMDPAVRTPIPPPSLASYLDAALSRHTCCLLHGDSPHGVSARSCAAHSSSRAPATDMQVGRVADLLLSLAEQDDSVVATDEWSLDSEWDELVALGS